MKNLNKLFILFFIFTSNTIIGQVLFDGSKSYQEYQRNVNQLIQSDKMDKSSIKKAARLDHMYESRLYPNGNLHAYQEELFSSIEALSQDGDSFENEWFTLGGGPQINMRQNKISGNGRISFIEFDPIDLNKIYVGTPSGCLWVSNDNGDQWEVLSSFPVCRGFSDMSVDPFTNDLYLITGDSDGRASPFHGIYKSTDSGETWELAPSPPISFAKKISINPLDEDHSYLIADNKLFISNSSNQEWNQVTELRDVQDFDWVKGTQNELFVFANDSLFSSMDYGENFSLIYSLDSINSRRTEIEITKTETDTFIYIATSSTGFGGFFGSSCPGIFKSDDMGNSFSLIDGSQGLTNRQQNYNFLFAAHPSEEDRLFVGWVELFWKGKMDSVWTEDYDLIEEFDFHADFHCHTFDPKDSDCMLIGNDGGIYRTCDLGETWEDISGNLRISQIYHFNNSRSCEDLVVYGSQDNGSAVLHDEIWKRIGSSDGLSCGISAGSNDTIYTSTQFKSLSRLDSLTKVLESENFFYTVNSVSPLPVNGAISFNNIFEVSPSEPGLCYYKNFKTLYKSNNAGTDWSVSLEADFSIYDIYLSNINSHLAIISNFNLIPTDSATYKSIQVSYTTDQGNNWETKAVQHPSIDSFLNKPIPTGVAFDDQETSNIWLALNRSGFHKILASSDSGDTWIDYSEGLPNIQINDIIHQSYSNRALYVATDVGVFFRNDTMSTWKCYSQSIPPTLFTELRISDVAQKLRASTFGYGIWETDLHDISATPPFANMDCQLVELCVGEEYLLSHSTSYNVSNTVWTVNGGNVENPNADSTLVSFSEEGSYDVSFIVSNANGTDSFAVEGKFIVYDNAVSIDVTNLGDGTYALTIPDNIDQILWNTGDTTINIIASETGWYSFVGVNENQCDVTDSIFLEKPVYIDNLASLPCKVYPNPTVNYLFVDCPDHAQSSVLISNSSGMTVKKITMKNLEKIELDRGFYLLQILDSQGRKVSNHKIFVTN